MNIFKDNISEFLTFFSSIIAIVSTGGWFVTAKAHKRQKNGEATQAEAEGWAKQQEVYQRTIADLEKSCEFIRNDRDELRKENSELKIENRELKNKVNELENLIYDLRKEVSRLGRRVEALSKDKK